MRKFGIVSVVEREKYWIMIKYSQADSLTHSRLALFRTLQSEYVYAQYLSEVKCFSHRRQYRSGCHGLCVHTGWWEGSVIPDRNAIHTYIHKVTPFVR